MGTTAGLGGAGLCAWQESRMTSPLKGKHRCKNCGIVIEDGAFCLGFFVGFLGFFVCLLIAAALGGSRC
jgi:hypothetical protein